MLERKCFRSLVLSLLPALLSGPIVVLCFFHALILLTQQCASRAVEFCGRVFTSEPYLTRTSQQTTGSQVLSPCCHTSTLPHAYHRLPHHRHYSVVPDLRAPILRENGVKSGYIGLGRLVTSIPKPVYDCNAYTKTYIAPVLNGGGYLDLRAPRDKPKQALLTTHCSHL